MKFKYNTEFLVGWTDLKNIPIGASVVADMLLAYDATPTTFRGDAKIIYTRVDENHFILTRSDELGYWHILW